MYKIIDSIFKNKDFSIVIDLKICLRYGSSELINFKPSMHVLSFKIIYIYFYFFEVVMKKKIVYKFLMKSEMTKAKTDVVNNYCMS